MLIFLDCKARLLL